MKTKSDPFRTKFHRDAAKSVTYWNVYTQGWRCQPASTIENVILATLPRSERDRIVRHAQGAR